VNAFAADLHRYAYLLCRNQTLAEDLVQETFLRAWRFLGSLRDERKAKSWLITTLRREYARTFERYQPELQALDPDRIADAGPHDPEKELGRSQLRRALAQLPRKYREVLTLQVVGGYNGAELSKLVGLPLATVNTRLFRARQQLRETLERPALEAGGG